MNRVPKEIYKRKFNLVTPELHGELEESHKNPFSSKSIPHESGIIFSVLAGQLKYLEAYQIVNGDERSFKQYVAFLDSLIRDYPVQAEKAGLYPIMDPKKI